MTPTDHEIEEDTASRDGVTATSVPSLPAGAADPVAWRPIESAPKDGSEFIVYREDAGVFAALWQHPPHKDGGLDWDEEPTLFSAGGCDLTRELPTHWMPLPLPPGRSSEPVAGDAALRLALNGVKAAWPIINSCIQNEYNVDTWGLHARLAALNAALNAAGLTPSSEAQPTSPSAASAGNPATDHVDLSPTTAGSAEGVKLDLLSVRDWLRGLPDLDMEDIAADGGVTVAMVVQQEAREMAGRLDRALASPPAGDGNSQWRCFHCDFATSDRNEAELHFGSRPIYDPMCRMTDAGQRREYITLDASYSRVCEELRALKTALASPAPTQTGEG